MSSSTIYTLNLTSEYCRKTQNLFSLDGPYLQVDSTDEPDSNVAGISYGDLDELEEKNLKYEMIVHKRMDPTVVLQPHNLITYVDFVRIVHVRHYQEPLVVSGGRDHYLCVSTMFSHKTVFREYLDEIPRCGVWDKADRFYVGCNKGLVVVMDLNEMKISEYHIGEVRIRQICISASGRHLAILNSDNAVILAKPGNDGFDIVSLEIFGSPVTKLCMMQENAVVMTADRSLNIL